VLVSGTCYPEAETVKDKIEKSFSGEKCFNKDRNRDEDCEIFTVAEIIYEFDSNPIRAQKTLSDHEVIVSGRIDIIRRGFLASFILELEGGIDLGIDDSQEDFVTALNPGDQIYCKGYGAQKFINPCLLLRKK